MDYLFRITSEIYFNVLPLETAVMSNSNPHVDRDLDLSNAGRGVWLVKVCILDVLNIIQKPHAHTSSSKLG